MRIIDLPHPDKPISAQLSEKVTVKCEACPRTYEVTVGNHVYSKTRHLCPVCRNKLKPGTGRSMGMPERAISRRREELSGAPESLRCPDCDKILPREDFYQGRKFVGVCTTCYDIAHNPAYDEPEPLRCKCGAIIKGKRMCDDCKRKAKEKSEYEAVAAAPAWIESGEALCLAGRYGG